MKKSRLRFIAAFLILATMITSGAYNVPLAKAAAHSVGSLVKTPDGTVWLITSSSERRPFTSVGAFNSYNFLSFNNVATANADDTALSVGSLIPPMDGKIITSDRGADKGTTYLVTNSQKAAFVSSEVFLGLGYSFNRGLSGDVSFLTSTTNITSTSEPHRPGSIINNNGTIQIVSNNGLWGFPSAAVYNSWSLNSLDAARANSADQMLPQTAVITTRQPGQLWYGNSTTPAPTTPTTPAPTTPTTPTTPAPTTPTTPTTPAPTTPINPALPSTPTNPTNSDSKPTPPAPSSTPGNEFPAPYPVPGEVVVYALGQYGLVYDVESGKQYTIVVDFGGISSANPQKLTIVKNKQEEIITLTDAQKSAKKYSFLYTHGSSVMPTKAQFVDANDNSINQAFGFAIPEYEINANCGRSSDSVKVTIPNQSVTRGSTIRIPINTSNLTGKNVYSYDGAFRYDPAVLRPASTPVIYAGTISENMTTADSAGYAGRIRMGAYSLYPLTGSGVLMYLQFTVVGNSGSSTSVGCEGFFYNEQDPASHTTGGTITVQ